MEGVENAVDCERITDLNGTPAQPINKLLSPVFELGHLFDDVFDRIYNRFGNVIFVCAAGLRPRKEVFEGNILMLVPVIIGGRRFE